jgi:hypothetical protein
MPHGMAMRYIIIPQAVRNILPALGNEFIVVIKESSIVSIIGLADLMYKADTVRGNTFQPFEPLLVAALVYFLMTFPLSKLLATVERRMRTVIETNDLRKTLRQARSAQRHLHDLQQGGSRRHHRPVGFRQEHVPSVPQPPGRAQPRFRDLRRRGHHPGGTRP